jgi:hypothetical protein
MIRQSILGSLLVLSMLGGCGGEAADTSARAKMGGAASASASAQASASATLDASASASATIAASSPTQ